MIAAALDQVVSDVERAGVRATRDPQQVQSMLVSARGPIVFVDAPSVSLVGLSGRVALRVPVHVVVMQPGLLADHEAAFAVICEVLPALRPAEPFQPVALQLGDTYYPAYRAVIERRV